MRKITLSIFVFVAMIGLNAQNLLTNPGFETWGETMPDPWYVVSTSVTGVKVSAATDIKVEGNQSMKVDVSGGSGTFNISQVVPIVPGGAYTITVQYNVTGGDGTDVRMWCNFKGANDKFFNDDELVATGLYEKLRSGNTNSSGSSYLPNGTGWQTFTTSFTAPATAYAFDFQVRTYKGATAYWDNASLVGPVPASVNSPKAQSLSAWTSPGKIHFNASAGESVEIYNAMGQKVLQTLADDGMNEINSSIKGVAIVKVGNRVGKVIL